MPGYGDTLRMPAWRVYEDGRCIASCRAANRESAERKLAEWRSGDGKRILRRAP